MCTMYVDHCGTSKLRQVKNTLLHANIALIWTHSEVYLYLGIRNVFFHL